MVDLNTLIDPLSGWELLDASDINEAGQITGQGLINNQYHAYLLTPVPLPGDFNNDGFVDAADYTVWRNNLNDPTEANIHNNGDGGDVGPNDYTWWKQHYGDSNLGSGGGGLAQSTVPEPTTLTTLLVIALSLLVRRHGATP